MERNLIEREVSAHSVSPSKPSWRWSSYHHDYYTSDLKDLIKLVQSVPLLSSIYNIALRNKFDLKGRIYVYDESYYYRIGGSRSSGGFTNKQKGEAYLNDFNKHSTIQNALHEAIHLLSHPLKGKNANHASFAHIFGSKLYEALTQHFTMVVMQQAKFAYWDDKKTYAAERKTYLEPFFKIFKELGISDLERDNVLKEVYFFGKPTVLINCYKEAIKKMSKVSLTDQQINTHAINIYRWSNQALLSRALVGIGLLKQLIDNETGFMPASAKSNELSADKVFYEDVKVRPNETILMLVSAYGYDPDDWRKIWNDPKNVALKNKRKSSDQIKAGDIIYIPIKWSIISQSLNPATTDAGINTFSMITKRDGKQGDRLHWVQTVYGHNQPRYPNQKSLPNFTVDEPSWDDKPYYWTQLLIDENATRPARISDRPARNPPSVDMGTTQWRAVTSLAVTTDKRISIWNTFVWGIDFHPDGTSTKYDIRPATKEEITGHLNLLSKKSGSSNRSFRSMGWTFKDRNGL